MRSQKHLRFRSMFANAVAVMAVVLSLSRHSFAQFTIHPYLRWFFNKPKTLVDTGIQSDSKNLSVLLISFVLSSGTSIAISGGMR